MSPIEHVSIGGVRVATASRADLARMVVEDCRRRRSDVQRRPRLLFDANGHGISMAARDKEYRAALEQADVVHADGGFLVTASRYLAGAPIAERSATTDLIHDVVRAGLEDGLSHYLLGSTETLNAACADRLKALYPNIVIAGRQHGYFRSNEEDAVLARINDAAPDVVWIGLGKPLEQLFAVRHREAMRTSWAITCGGCFNYIAGDYSRAPLWMQDNNLEWLYRAATNPKLIKRYLTTSPHALSLTLQRVDRRTYSGAQKALR